MFVIRPRIFYKKPKVTVCIPSNNVDSEGSSSSEEDDEHFSKHSSAAKKKKRVGCIVPAETVNEESSESECDKNLSDTNNNIVIPETSHSELSDISSPAISLATNLSSPNGSVHTSPPSSSVIEQTKKLKRKVLRKKTKPCVLVSDRYASVMPQSRTSSQSSKARRSINGLLGSLAPTSSISRGSSKPQAKKANVLRKRALVPASPKETQVFSRRTQNIMSHVPVSTTRFGQSLSTSSFPESSQSSARSRSELSASASTQTGILTTTSTRQKDGSKRDNPVKLMYGSNYKEGQVDADQDVRLHNNRSNISIPYENNSKVLKSVDSNLCKEATGLLEHSTNSFKKPDQSGAAQKKSTSIPLLIDYEQENIPLTSKLNSKTGALLEKCTKGTLRQSSSGNIQQSLHKENQRETTNLLKVCSSNLRVPGFETSKAINQSSNVRRISRKGSTKSMVQGIGAKIKQHSTHNGTAKLVENISTESSQNSDRSRSELSASSSTAVVSQTTTSTRSRASFKGIHSMSNLSKVSKQSNAQARRRGCTKDIRPENSPSNIAPVNESISNDQLTLDDDRCSEATDISGNLRLENRNASVSQPSDNDLFDILERPHQSGTAPQEAKATTSLIDDKQKNISITSEINSKTGALLEKCTKGSLRQSSSGNIQQSLHKENQRETTNLLNVCSSNLRVPGFETSKAINQSSNARRISRKGSTKSMVQGIGAKIKQHSTHNGTAKLVENISTESSQNSDRSRSELSASSSTAVVSQTITSTRSRASFKGIHPMSNLSKVSKQSNAQARRRGCTKDIRLENSPSNIAPGNESISNDQLTSGNLRLENRNASVSQPSDNDLFDILERPHQSGTAPQEAKATTSLMDDEQECIPITSKNVSGLNTSIHSNPDLSMAGDMNQTPSNSNYAKESTQSRAASTAIKNTQAEAEPIDFGDSISLIENLRASSDSCIDSSASELGEGWRVGDLQEIQFNDSPIFTTPVEEKPPVEYFYKYFDEEIMNLIVNETNLYTTQKRGKSLNVSAEEIYAFFGILIYMGICRLPALVDYWTGSTRIPQIANVMPRRRFQDIHSSIHFHNNEEEGDDRLLKIRPVLDHIRKKCQEEEQEYALSVDERMQKYKGTRAGNIRQYMPDKPSSKWGFKLFVLAGASGMTHDFIPYCGSNTFAQENISDEVRKLGLGATAVVALCQSIKNPVKTTVTFDNYYTGIPLVIHLRDKMNLHSLGTIRRNRTLQCPLSDAKKLEKKGRGSHESHVNKNAVCVVQWADNKTVCLASTFVGVEPVGTIKRYSKEHKGKIDVQCPRAVLKYNESMGGVDLGDMFMALYAIPTKARRWYFPLLGYCLEVTLTNGWLQYKRDCVVMGTHQSLKSSKEFRIQCSEALMGKLLRSKGRPSLDNSLKKKLIRRPMASRPSDSLRTDEFNHWPARCDKGRCRYCSSQIRFKCTKCDARLCITQNKNCFVQFHITKSGKLPVNKTFEDEEDENEGEDEDMDEPELFE